MEWGDDFHGLQATVTGKHINLRFDNKEIKNDITEVIQTIKSWIKLNE